MFGRVVSIVAILLFLPADLSNAQTGAAFPPSQMAAPESSGKAPAADATKKDPLCNTDCDHICLDKDASLPAMIGNDGVMFRLPNGTWCSAPRK
jgi:hypothetical protein